MRNIQFVYIYLTSAISLQSVLWALISMLRSFVSPAPIRSDADYLAFQLAVIIIGLPIFILHWAWAQRISARQPDHARLPLRRFYLYAVLAASLAPALANTFGLLAYEDMRLPYYLVTIIPLAILFLYHQRVLEADLAAAPPADVNRRLRSLYIFAFSLSGLWMAAAGASNLFQWLFQQVGASSLSPRLIDPGLNPEFTRLGLGLLLWLVFWLWAQRLFADPGSGELASLERKLYLYLVVFASSLGAVGAATALFARWLETLLDVRTPGPGQGPEYALAFILTMGVVWAYHAYALRRDAEAAPDEFEKTGVRHIYLYLVAAVGLGAFLTGLAGDIFVLIDSLTQSAAIGTGGRGQFAWFTAALIAGLPVWVLPWRTIQSPAAQPADTNPLAGTARRIYLYLYLFAAVMAAIGSLVYIVYQLLLLAMGERAAAGLLNDLANALAIAAIGAGVLVYHGRLLRGDASRELAVQRDAQAGRRILLLASPSPSGDALYAALTAEYPSAAIERLDPAAVAAKDFSRALQAAGLVVLPSGLAIPPKQSAAVDSASAAKLVVPDGQPNWHWAGLPPLSLEQSVAAAVVAVGQYLEGRPLRPGRSLGLAFIILIVIGSLCLLSMVASLIFGG